MSNEVSIGARNPRETGGAVWSVVVREFVQIKRIDGPNQKNSMVYLK
ncbi:MAG: hypothetical protein IPO04_16430 [Cytophagaceae bacterium]|nr:hypothetical protein [Cytophagaceae bacterium]